MYNPKKPIYPKAFPFKLEKDLQRFIGPQDTEVYKTAVDTCFQGFVVDTPQDINGKLHERVAAALEDLDSSHYFVTDVTQPLGLGTPLAKTYVTRCLLGDAGTTYKYLGLRMFSYSWDNLKNSSLSSIKDLNETLQRRTKIHLENLSKQRGRPATGRSLFDVTLINKMESVKSTESNAGKSGKSGKSRSLKKEPTFNDDLTSVSWHADSSLEHYSSIAVYHVIAPSQAVVEAGEKPWRVALKVQHDAEGPSAGALVRPGAATPAESASPLLAAPLPSRSAYYLLDDFNHHHAHAVLASTTKTPSVRYSSTHRLLRSGGAVQQLLVFYNICGIYI
jgi:alpha-ketoglutarate-dependent dioxygenase FTO